MSKFIKCYEIKPNYTGVTIYLANPDTGEVEGVRKIQVAKHEHRHRRYEIIAEILREEGFTHPAFDSSGGP